MKFMTQEIIATRRTPAEDALSRAETSSVKVIHHLEQVQTG